MATDLATEVGMTRLPILDICEYSYVLNREDSHEAPPIHVTGMFLVRMKIRTILHSADNITNTSENVRLLPAAS